MRAKFNPNAEEMLKDTGIYVPVPSNLKGKWKNEFNNMNEINIEIGMGKGNFIIQLAQKYPNINFIGIEKNISVLSKVVTKIEDEKIHNLRIISEDAIDLETMFENGEVSKIYLNFSDPWHKNRHYKRRLTYRRFLDIYRNILVKDGVVEFKTDNQRLFEFTITEIANTQRFIEYISLDLHNEQDIENIMTEYEKKFSEKGNRIYKLIWR